MFQFLKRAVFLSRNAGIYMRSYGMPIAEDHKTLLESGWPSNEFVDWYMETAGKSWNGMPTHEFCKFMYMMYRWVLNDDEEALYELHEFANERMRITGDREKLYTWLKTMVIETKKARNSQFHQYKKLTPILFDPSKPFLIPDVTQADAKAVLEGEEYTATHVSNVPPFFLKSMASNLEYIHVLVLFNKSRLPVFFINYEHNSLTNTYALCTLESDGRRSNYGRDDDLLNDSKFLEKSLAILESNYSIQLKKCEPFPTTKTEVSGTNGKPLEKSNRQKTTPSLTILAPSTFPTNPASISEGNDSRNIIPSDILLLKGIAKLDVPKRIQLKKFFANSNKETQISAMKYIFTVTDTEAAIIAAQIKHAFEQQDFIPWPNKK